MTYTYTSIFEGSSLITKKDLCKILNLDTKRLDLKFSAFEINKAFRARAIFFHPDKQRSASFPIPEEVCNAAINDFVLARKYMLADENNIPGKNFKNNFTPFYSRNWSDTFINLFKDADDGILKIKRIVDWTYFFSSNFLALMPLSTFSNGQLNFRLINTYSKELDIIRPFLKNIDGSNVADFLRFLRDFVKTIETQDIFKLLLKIKEISPKLLESFIEDKKADELILAISKVKNTLSEVLTDEFIDKAQYLTAFWPKFIANIPTWKNILTVYFSSIIFTASSLPKFFNVLKVTSEIILKQKGMLQYLLTMIPFIVLSTLMLSLNLGVHIGFFLSRISFMAVYPLISNSFLVVSSLIGILGTLNPSSDLSVKHNLFSLFEGSFNLTVRFSLNLILELLDSVIYLLSNRNLLSSPQVSINDFFDTMLNYIRPEPRITEKAAPVMSKKVVPIKEDTTSEKPRTQPAPTSSPAFGFFAEEEFLNKEDLWLKNLLENIKNKQEQTEEFKAAAV